jgi:hypothetical protein
MKKRKLIGLASLFLALGVVGCGDEGSTTTDNPDGGETTTCEHEYVLTSLGDKQHQEVCSKCGDKKTAKNHSFSKDPDKVSENKDPTCTEDGWEFQKCKCGETRKNPKTKLGHSYTVVESTTATCTEDGENTMKCSRCGDISTEKQPQEKLGHAWVADDSYTEGLAATCAGKGTAREKCSREGCSETRIVETDPLGHDYLETAGEDTYETTNVAALTTGTCKRDGCDGKRVYWNALQLTTNCKTNKRLGRAAVDDDPATEDVNEAAEAFYEPNYVEEGDGIRFWGRPIHNALTLSDEGRSSSSDHVSVYDAEVTGSYFEYNINLAAAMTDVKFVADMAPTADLGTGDLYKANSGDWTPGLIDSTDNLYSHRFVVTLDGVELTFDDSDNPCPGSDRGWFTFPINKFNVTAGPHTIRIAMAGGYLSTFYGFGLEKEVGKHEHDFVKDTTLSKDATCTEDGRFYGVCACGFVKDEVIPALGHDLAPVAKEGDREATCLNAGVKHQECTRCDYEEDTAIPALGHDFVAGTPVVEDGYATVTPYECSRDGVERYVIKGNDVNAETKTEKIITPADEEAGTPAVTQANYVENRDGSVKFNNVPIHNANGGSSRPTEDTYPTLYSPDEEGSFMAYTFKTGNLEDVKLIMEIKPNQYLGNSRKIFSNDLSSDWTPGLKKIGEGDSATYEAYQERFVFELDGTELELDLDSEYNEIAGSTQRWFTVPLKNQLDFAAGAHTIKIRMGGGYVCDIYNVGVQTKDTEAVIPPTPVDDSITLDVANATGYTDKTTKMKSNAVFTLGEGAGKVNVAPGEYKVEIKAKMTSGSHSDRKWYNMAKADLCVDGVAEETLTNNPDTAAQADFRYYMMVDDTVYNPETKDNWGTLGLDTSDYNAVRFVDKIVVKPGSSTITIAHGDIGFSLYVEGVKLTKTGEYAPTAFHTWGVSDVNWGTISKKSGNNAAGEALDMYKFGTGNEVTLTYNNTGAERDVYFRVFASTKTSNIDACKVYEQTAGTAKYVVTVNDVAVNYNAEGVLPNKNIEGVDPIAYSIGNVGLVGGEGHNTTINDSGIVAEPIWFDYCLIHLAAGENTINFKKPDNAGYSIYFGAFALAE